VWKVQKASQRARSQLRLQCLDGKERDPGSWSAGIVIAQCAGWWSDLDADEEINNKLGRMKGSLGHIALGAEPPASICYEAWRGAFDLYGANASACSGLGRVGAPGL